MSQYVDGQTKSYEADEAIAQYARVKLDADGKITNAGIADRGIGTAMREAFAAGDVIAVRLNSAAGTHKVIAAAAVTAGDRIYTAATGKVSVSASTAYEYGTALETATADGDIIEALIENGETAVV